MTVEFTREPTLTRTPIAAEQVSVVIPCYNEEGRIGTTLDLLLDQFPELEVIVVDDGSSDESACEVARRTGVLLLRHERNRGQGASLVTGMRRASRAFLVWYDADGQHTPEMLALALHALPGFDCVIGNRSSHGLGVQNRRLGRRLLHWAARVMTGAPVGDVNSGLRAFRREIIAKYLHLIPPRFSASTVTTILMIERGYRVGWIDITVPRRGGTSSLSPMRDGWQALVLIVQLVQLFHPMRFFFPVSACMIIMGSIYGFTRAFIAGRGIPDLAVVIVLTGVQILFFGLMSDQISAMRKERFE